MTIAIIGLGLIGGSMAKSIKARTGHTVYGFDLDQETLLLARMCGAMDAPLTDELLAQCDLIFLALRPQAAMDWAKAHADAISPQTLLMDLCGVKRAVVGPLSALAQEKGFAYLGAHPMAGRERGGFTASSADLFEGASMILTPQGWTDMDRMETLKALFLDLGFSSLTFSDPEEHDRIIAYTSQLAHVVSSAYVQSPEALRRRGFSAGSFRDMTRVARLDEDMWTELFLDDSDYLTQELEGLVDRLNAYLTALKAQDSDALRALLKAGREQKAAAGGI